MWRRRDIVFQYGMTLFVLMLMTALVGLGMGARADRDEYEKALQRANRCVRQLEIQLDGCRARPNHTIQVRM